MYERFTDRGRTVLRFAVQEAQRFNHEYIGTEHILLGLVKEGEGVAAKVLQSLNVDLRRIRLEVEKLLRSGPDPVDTHRLHQTPGAKRVIEFAMEEARALKHTYIGTEHILLGLLREGQGIASAVLYDLGLTLEQVRQEIVERIGLGLDDDSTTEVSTPEVPRESFFRHLGRFFKDLLGLRS